MMKIFNEREISSFSDGWAGSLLKDEIVISSVRKTLNITGEMLSGIKFILFSSQFFDVK